MPSVHQHEQASLPRRVAPCTAGVRLGFDRGYCSFPLWWAIERAGSKAGNKGWEAAMSAIEMANVYRQLHR